MTKEERRDVFQFLRGLIREHGDFAPYRNAYGPVYFFNHPDQVQAVLQNTNFARTSLLSITLGRGILSSEGEFWRAQRRLMQPVFHDQQVPAFGSVVTAATLAMLKRWDAVAASGAPLDVAAEMRRLTLLIIVKALFSTDLGDHADEWETALTTVLDDLGALSMTQFNMPPPFSPTRNERLRSATAILDGHVQQMIDERRAEIDKPRDLLSLLVTGRDETAGRPLTDRQVRDEVLTLLLAGHETTAIALAWAWYLISGHPAVEARLLSEVEAVLGDRVPTAADLPRLPYTRMVLEETMRLYPPVSFTSRQALADDAVCGHPVPAKTVVLLSAWSTHRHKDFWDDPEAFDPDRFAPERTRGRHRFAYFPFSSGRHLCLGQAFAMTEGQLIMALVLQRYRLLAVPSHPVQPEPAITLRPREGFLATLERRALGNVGLDA